MYMRSEDLWESESEAIRALGMVVRPEGPLACLSSLCLGNSTFQPNDSLPKSQQNWSACLTD